MMFLRLDILNSQIYFPNHLGIQRNVFSNVLGFSVKKFENFDFKSREVNVFSNLVLTGAEIVFSYYSWQQRKYV